MLKLIVVVTWVVAGRPPEAMELRWPERFSYHEACEARGADVARRAMSAVARTKRGPMRITSTFECELPEGRDA